MQSRKKLKTMNDSQVSSSSTSIVVKSFQFTFSIPEYSYRVQSIEPGKKIRQRFTLQSESWMSFILDFYPKGCEASQVQNSLDHEQNDIKTAIFLKISSENKRKNSFHIEFCVIDGNGKSFFSECFHEKIPFIKHWGTDLVSTAELEDPANNLLPNDTLSISCRIQETDRESEECDCPKETPATCLPTTNLRFTEDFSNLLCTEKNSDVRCLVNDVKFHAHKIILAARSPVFDAMFQQNRVENNMDVVEVDGIQPSVFACLLKFVYTGHCELADEAEQLYQAAIKYEMEDLKQFCEVKLQKMVNLENAIQLLIFSDLHGANGLKGCAIKFINRNAAEVMKKPEWLEFKQSHLHLIAELYSVIVDVDMHRQ